MTRFDAELRECLEIVLGAPTPEPSVAAALHMKGASAEKVFGELRERKNKS